MMGLLLAWLISVYVAFLCLHGYDKVQSSSPKRLRYYRVLLLIGFVVSLGAYMILSYVMMMGLPQ